MERTKMTSLDQTTRVVSCAIARAKCGGAESVLRSGARRGGGGAPDHTVLACCESAQGGVTSPSRGTVSFDRKPGNKHPPPMSVSSGRRSWHSERLLHWHGTGIVDQQRQEAYLDPSKVEKRDGQISTSVASLILSSEFRAPDGALAGIAEGDRRGRSVSCISAATPRNCCC